MTKILMTGARRDHQSSSERNDAESTADPSIGTGIAPQLLQDSTATERYQCQRCRRARSEDGEKES